MCAALTAVSNQLEGTRDAPINATAVQYQVGRRQKVHEALPTPREKVQV